MSDTVADDELAAFVDRILRMKSEEDAIKSDIKEIYAEVKARGYDKTRLGETVSTVRKLEKDSDGEAEKEAIRDLYLAAYFRAKNKPHAHAYARDDEDEPEHDPETGEITEQPSVVAHDAEGAEDVSNAVALVPATQDGNANKEGDYEVPAQPEPVNLDRRPGPRAPEVGQNGSEHQRSASPETNEAPAGRVADESPASNLTTFTPKPLRPYCQNPGNNCGGMGKKHCWQCEKAHSEKQGAA